MTEKLEKQNKENINHRKIKEETRDEIKNLQLKYI
jgi:hypothetical protein